MLPKILLERGCTKSRLTLNFRLMSSSKLGHTGSSMCMTGHRMNQNFIMTIQILRTTVMNIKQTSGIQWLWKIPKAFDYENTRNIFRADKQLLESPPNQTGKLSS